MNLFLVLIVIVLIGLTVAAVMGKIGGFMAEPTTSQSFGGVPAEPLSTLTMTTVHFDQALRGYRMNQVDEVIDALTARLKELESAVSSVSATGEPTPSGVEPTLLPGDPHDVNEPKE